MSLPAAIAATADTEKLRYLLGTFKPKILYMDDVILDNP